MTLHNHENPRDSKKCNDCKWNDKPFYGELKASLEKKVALESVTYSSDKPSGKFDAYNRPFNNRRALTALRHFEKAKTDKSKKVWAYVVGRHLDFPQSNVACWLGVCVTVLRFWPAAK